MANRRTVLIGMGGLVAAGGAALGTGAFTTVEAQRTVNIETAADSNALLQLQPADRDDDEDGVQNEFVEETDGEIVFNLDGYDNDDDVNATGLNKNARTSFRKLVTVTNQGNQDINTLNLQFTTVPSDVTANDTFTFLIEGDSLVREDHSDATDMLQDTDGVPATLTPGESITFGLEIDLIEGGNSNDLPEEGTYTLTIEAQTANSNTGT